MSVHCTITRSVQCIYIIHCNLSSAIFASALKMTGGGVSWFLDELLGKLEKNRILPRLWTFCKLNMLFFLALRLVFLLADLLQVNLLETARLVKLLIYVFFNDWLIDCSFDWLILIDRLIYFAWLNLNGILVKSYKNLKKCP